MNCLLVISNFPNPEMARQIGTKAVELQLAACVNLIPSVESIYLWNGKLETENETTGLFKTTNARFSALEEFIRSHHPYELPEIIAIPIEDGSEAYLKWIRQSCGGSGTRSS